MRSFNAKIAVVIAALAIVVGGGRVVAQDLNLTTPDPLVPRGISFQYAGAGYDSYYKNHWLIASQGGYISIGFDGPRTIAFQALGSTVNGVSYCRINVYVDGQMYWQNRFIGKHWESYFIPPSVFRRGRNVLTIELTGQTHLWINQIQVSGGKQDYGGDRFRRRDHGGRDRGRRF